MIDRRVLGRIVRANRRLVVLDADMDCVRRDVSALKAQIDEMNARFDRIESHLHQISNRLERQHELTLRIYDDVQEAREYGDGMNGGVR